MSDWCEVRDPRFTASVVCTLEPGHDGRHFDLENSDLGFWEGPKPPGLRDGEDDD